MTDRINNIPSIFTKGSFQANAPFNKIINPTVFYTVEAIRTINEMQGLNRDLHKLIFNPVGLSNDESIDLIKQINEDNGVIVVLTSNNSEPVYIPSTYIKALPLTDGVVYDRLCIFSYLGAVPPSLKDKLKNALIHFDNYIKTNIGITATSKIAAIPDRGYVSKQQSDAWEKSRQLQIEGSKSDIEIAELYKKENSELKTYILKLEGLLKK